MTCITRGSHYAVLLTPLIYKIYKEDDEKSETGFSLLYYKEYISEHIEMQGIYTEWENGKECNKKRMMINQDTNFQT